MPQDEAVADTSSGWRAVRVDSSKWDGSFHRSTPSLELGTDEFGTWLWMPPGTVAQTRSGSFHAVPGLRLIPVGQMWSAYFVPSSPPASRPASVYVDITTPNQRIGDVFEFIDLDLDVEVASEGPVRVLDRDEFTAHAREWRYPEDVLRSAEATCARLAGALTNHEPPFDGTYLSWWRNVDPRVET